MSARIIVGDAQMETGHYGLAADAYTKVASTSPNAPAIEVRQARLAFIEGKTEEARRLAALAQDDAVASALGARISRSMRRSVARSNSTPVTTIGPPLCTTRRSKKRPTTTSRWPVWPKPVRPRVTGKTRSLSTSAP